MKKKTAIKKPSESWREPVETLRQRILADYKLDAIGHQLLENALNAYKRMLQAGEILEAEGLVVVDRFRQVKAHPCYEQEQSARLQVLRHFRNLGLDMGKLLSEGKNE